MKKSKVKEKKKIRKRKQGINVIQVISVLFIIYFVYTLYDQQIKINKYDSQIEMYEADIKNKNNLVQYYKEQNKNIQSDEYIESVAREKLGYVKPYEKIFVDANR